MTLTSLTSSDLKRIAKLLTQKETLRAGIQKIDLQLASFEGGKPAAKAAGARPPKRRRGLKNQVIGLLKKAGKEGLTVKQVAAKVKLNPNRIYTWFYGTGKRIQEIKKVGEAKYRWEA